MFIGSCNGIFRRLDAETGAVRWETNVLGNAMVQYFFHGDVFLTPDRIIASADVDARSGVEAGVHAFDLDSGRQLWMHPAGGGMKGTVIGLGRRAFAYHVNGDLVALDLESGKREWSHALKAPAWESPGGVGRRVFAGSSDGSLYAFDSETGRIEWRQKLGAAISTSVRATESDVYAGTSDGMMHRLSAASGEILSSLELDPALQPGSAPLVRRDAVLVLLVDRGANYRALVSLDPALRRVNWRRAAPDRWNTTRVFATGKTIVVGTPTGEVTAYCAADGSPAWSHKLSGERIRAVGGSDETLYVGTTEGTLYAVRPPASCIE